ncbi:hypothetical protein ABID58_004420 [Bradyrhizobium sp. S3.2.6]|uniref:hypothetical protein n=1 Tax=Bradyrhizobium sp. S3.2.6 TaxID=3156428 RepID=UPI0033960E59
MKSLAYGILIVGFLATAATGADLKYNPSDCGSIGCPTKPTPFTSDAGSATLPLTITKNPKSEIRSYSGQTPIVDQPMNDPRLPQRYRGQSARTYSGWDFVAVRTRGSNGQDATTVRMSFNVVTHWASTDPASNVLFSKNGRVIKFLDQGGGILFSFSDVGRTTGGGFGNCGATGRATEQPFQIENSVFEATVSIQVDALPELFLACN